MAVEEGSPAAWGSGGGIFSGRGLLQSPWDTPQRARAWRLSNRH